MTESRRSNGTFTHCHCGSAMLAPMANLSAKPRRPQPRSWRTPIADVPTDGSVEMIFEALLPIPGQAAHWLLMRRRIADLCLKIHDRQKASKLYRELMAICEQQEMNRPRGGSSSR